MGTTNELPTYPEDGAKTKSSSRGQREVHAGFQTGYFIFPGPPSTRVRICQNIHQFGSCSLILNGTDAFSKVLWLSTKTKMSV